LVEFSKEQITDIKVSATGILPKWILDAGNYLTQNPKTGNWAGACPKCGGEDRFAVFINQNRDIKNGDFFNCRTCHWRGDIIAYAIEEMNLGFVEALQMIEGGHKRYGADTTTYTGDISAAPADVAVAEAPVAVAEAVAEEPTVFTPTREKLDPVMLKKHMDHFRFNLLVEDEHPDWQVYPNDHGARDFSPLEYLEHRGLDMVAAKKFNLGFNPEWLDIEGTKLAPGIVIPLYYQNEETFENELIGFNVRTFLPELQKKGKYMRRGAGSYLLNKASLDVHKIAVVVEGEFDCALLDKYIGDKYAVVTYGSVTGTSQLTASDMAVHFMNQKKVYWCMDQDTAGTAALEKIMNNNAGTNGNRFERLSLPEGDITDFLMDKGEEAFDNFFATNLLNPPYPWDTEYED